LLLTIVRVGDPTPVARASVEVRSVKMDYREHYRGMLSHIAERCAGLLLDSRASTRLRLSPEWRTNPRILEQQLEFLRHTLESPVFRGALDEILRNPHRHLEDQIEEAPIGRAFRSNRALALQISHSRGRVALPEGHALRRMHPGLRSLPSHVPVAKRIDFLDTPENRFVKMVLVEFRDFLAEVSASLGRKATDAAKPENQRLLREAARLRSSLDSALSRSFLPDVSRPELLPLGSPLLQRKAGYRELLHLWLQFHVGAQLAWEGGQDVWQGGVRNVATLYEYWLFFQLESLFRKTFACREPLHSVLVVVDGGLPRLKLQRGLELQAPIGGARSATAGRHLMAEFQFNRKFNRRLDHREGGSWTRGVQPDYTISIWPAEFTKADAEATEAIVHIHFDAKYRVEFGEELFGVAASEEVIQDRAAGPREGPTAAKYADLLKMHAYRDAIRRTGGAYVLYPGKAGDGQRFDEFVGFHEVLPGLGAFAVRPRLDGTAEGMADVARFLDDVVEHLANRTTARERLSFHVAESYVLREEPVPYGALRLAERDEMSDTLRALPSAEHHVVAAWYESPLQLEWTRRKGIANVRLGRRPGTWHLPPELASVRHVLLRSHRGKVADGLYRLTKPGFKVFTAGDLRASGYPGAAAGEIYAVFEVEVDPIYAGRSWDSATVTAQLKEFESRRSYRQVSSLRRRSPDPRVLSLRELLKAIR